MFITFEGIEGSGKTVQVGLAAQYLQRQGKACVITREPGGTEFGIALRHVLLLSHGAPREPLSELLLYLADRYQDLKEVIEPAERKGAIVISDRYHDATRAYQGAGRGISPVTIESLARVLGIPEPAGTIVLDLDPETGLRRARQRNAADASADAEGRFEAEDLSFHRKVREGYLELARQHPGRIRVVAADGSPGEVFARIAPILDEWTNPAGRRS